MSLVENEIILSLLLNWQPSAKLEKIEEIAPDASDRCYFRLYLRGASVETAVLMVYKSFSAGEVVNEGQMRVDQQFIELAGYFLENGLRVPQVFSCDYKNSIFLLEDFGKTQLISILQGESNSDLAKKNAYLGAIDQLVLLQGVAPTGCRVCHGRTFSSELVLREVSEYSDYVLQPQAGALWGECEEIFSNASGQIALDFSEQPFVLSHRDYHSWNLLVDKTAQVGVIDFQDCLMAPVLYDLVALLNDRDTDRELGQELYKELFSEFVKRVAYPGDALRDYSLVLLQRDLKVAGRFSKFVRERGMNRYNKWVQGTEERIGRTLVFLSQSSSVYRELLECFTEVSDNIKQGVKRGALFNG